VIRRALLLSLLSGPAMAAPEAGHEHHNHGHGAQPHEEVAAPTVPPEIFKEFQAIEALAAKSAYSEAEGKIRELLPRLQDNPSARALLLRNLATLYGLRKHYARAAETLQEALALHALPKADAGKARLEQGQYYLAAEDYPKAAEAFSAWIAEAQAPAPEHFLLLADLRTQLKQYPEAAALVEKAIAASPAPKPEWYQRLLGLYHEMRDFRNCARVLRTLIEQSPDDPRYWQQLTGLYQEAGQEAQALAVQQLMYSKGMLKSSEEIVQLAQVLRYRSMPTRAAELLQREIGAGRVEGSARNLELLADAWTEARELGKASAALEKAAAQTNAGDTYHRLGQLYSEQHDWAKARQSLGRALARGGLKNPGGAWLLLGLAEYRLNARTEAREAFVKALDTPAVRKSAQQWLEHIDREARQGRGNRAREKSG
jgi:tetratricopeptide (TPR) repeat protein